jgi:hypothetical protein
MGFLVSLAASLERLIDEVSLARLFEFVAENPAHAE